MLKRQAALRRITSLVNSHTEWDPLEEVIVGCVEGSCVPEWHVSGQAVWPEKHWEYYKKNGGKGIGFDSELVKKASKELDHLCNVLKEEGVTVRRPDMMDHSQKIKTPDFETGNSLYAAMPRDVLIVIGEEIIEAPMAWRSRFFEYRPFRNLIKEYFRSGAKWTAAPKPLMSDNLYEETVADTPMFSSVVTEYEPVFDAAEFTRIGADIFCQRSHVTNTFGIDWLQRHLGDKYTIHTLDFNDRNGMHIDGTFIPLAEGKLLINPERACLTGSHETWYSYEGEKKKLCLPESFKDWDVFVAPKPELSADVPLYFTSPWTATANVLMLDSNRVIVEASETECIKRFKSWGFTPIPVPFRSFLPFGGSFHCATCDVRRKGEYRKIL
eukprot:TRINITY_DN33764_c0_g1_i1.p1 TRINITY_DN33764_c0_g1~~TRINITY_DN33764_c0_g1_i1.p1  ORF type:complete len:383 (+),score=25.80 TRINITY_DN33764_c0_g1_i1:52-1200(+)